MKILKQIFLILAITIGASMAASAQDKDQKQRPPKEPPKIVPHHGKGGKEKPPENRPKDDDRNKDNRGKKPQMFLSKMTGETEIYFV